MKTKPKKGTLLQYLLWNGATGFKNKCLSKLVLTENTKSGIDQLLFQMVPSSNRFGVNRLYSKFQPCSSSNDSYIDI